MTCPKCNGEMEQGYLQSSRELTWSPQRRGSLSRTFPGDVKFVANVLHGANIPAHCCRRCSFILAEFDEGQVATEEGSLLKFKF